MEIEPTVQHHGSLVEAADLHEEVSPRHLGDAQEEAKLTLERVADQSVDRLEGIFVAIECEEAVRAPQPGEELVESMLIREPLADDRLEQRERAGEVPADVFE